MPPALENAQKINVLAQADEHYAQHLSAMLVSLFHNNADNCFNLFVLVPHDIGQHIIDKICLSLRDFKASINFVPIKRKMVEDLRVVGHPTTAAYYKLFCGELMPQHINRVIYLDSDIIVRSNIQQLWHYDLGKFIAGAVPNARKGAHARIIKQKLGLSDEEGYFNSGVMLIDLNRWREASIGLQALRFVRENPDRMTYNDQCALNWVLRKRWMPLSTEWNLQSLSVTRLRWGCMNYTRQSKKRAEAAKLIHFTGNSKPWDYMNNHPLKHEYLHYLSQTEWKRHVIQESNIRNVIKKHIYNFSPEIIEKYYRLRYDKKYYQ